MTPLCPFIQKIPDQFPYGKCFLGTRSMHVCVYWDRFLNCEGHDTYLSQQDPYPTYVAEVQFGLHAVLLATGSGAVPKFVACIACFATKVAVPDIYKKSLDKQCFVTG